MKGRLKDLYFGRDGESILSVAVREDVRELFDELKDFDVNVEVKKYRGRRSLDANAYAWVLIHKLAADLRLPPNEVYREHVRQIGGASDVVCVKETAFGGLKAVWESRGIGWQCERMDSKLDGCVNAVLWSGSSVFDTEQMSQLIDNIVQDCKALGIPTETPDEIENIKSRWANAPKKGS